MKKFWLVLFPNTFIWIKNNNGIIYNSENFYHFTFYCCDEIKMFYNTLVDLSSLYSVEINETDLQNRQIREWIGGIIDIEAGSLTEQNEQNEKPVSYYPLVKIQTDVKVFNWMHRSNIGGKILENLHELTFYLNGSHHGSDKYFRQTLYPVYLSLTLDFKRVESFVHQCYNRRLNQVNFIGDPANYKDYDKLQEWVLSNNYPVHFVLLQEDVTKDVTKLKWFKSDKTNITIVVNNHSTLFEQLSIYNNFHEHITFEFPVTSMNHFGSVSTNLENTDIKNYKIIPLYDGTNIEFFEDHVYITPNEINNIKLSKREIFANMTLNTYSFGKLTIMPDGQIYSNVNDAPLGTISDPIYDMLYKEMNERKTWFRIRDMKPCCDCVYQWLCPSPGNYELVIGKPNLCHINP